jgi:hypothetical protein
MITTETTRTGSRAGRGGRVRRLRCCSPPAGFYAPGGAGVVRAGVAVAGMGPAAAGPRAPRVYRAGLASSIHWRNCGVRLDCARVQVPLDWARPAGPKITLEGIRHRASRPGRRIGTLFNPGGPGSSGVDAVKDPFTGAAAGPGRRVPFRRGELGSPRRWRQYPRDLLLQRGKREAVLRRPDRPGHGRVLAPLPDQGGQLCGPVRPA